MNNIPAYLYLIRSRSRPEIAILCTELHLAKWVNQIIDKGEQPEIEPITPAQIQQMLTPNHLLN